MGGGACRAEGDMRTARPRCTTDDRAGATATGANCPMKQEEAHCRVRAWEKPTAPDTGEWGRHVGRGRFVSVGEHGRQKGRPGGSGKGRPGGSGKQVLQNILVQI